MADHPSPRSTTRQQCHERIEHYTPDGASGRLLVAVPSGSVGVYSLVWSVAGLITSSAFWAPFLLAGVSLGLVVFSLMMIWPVYLSLIGNVESPEAYSQPDATPPSEENHDDSIAVAKRQYAAGNISEMEFERRVETILDTDARMRPESGTTNYRDDTDVVRETN
ncbi:MULTISPECIES: hypothetical protein [Halococcus]|uniref:SHOCT domain-containing protein n=1 Tax=Halococcus salifodinae DSM 8989 TaxID=1227456 RepID=M0MWX3_9EURY|nr:MULTISPECIES: hypothetical protein [Halococcus]EMA49334.1 hypothetical protein C450_17492 [Halococcus salifodinae DSM 8989]